MTQSYNPEKDYDFIYNPKGDSPIPRDNPYMKDQLIDGMPYRPSISEPPQGWWVRIWRFLFQ